MADVYGVDTYQINVGAGDCSVHILAKNPGPNDNRGEVVHAVLVDGGNITDRHEYINQSLRDIAPRYNNSSANSVAPIQFHSLVVTHWDADHYVGMFDLLESDLTAQYKKAAEVIVDKFDAWDKDPQKKAEEEPPRTVDLTKVQSNYLRYGPKGEYLTTFYCPNWESSATAKYEADQPKPKRKRGGRAPKDTTLTFNGAPSDPDKSPLLLLDAKTGLVSVIAGTHQTDAVSASRGENGVKETIFVPAFKVVYDAINLIGMNIFTKTLATPAGASVVQPWTSIKSLAALLAEHKAAVDMPGMYCVAAARQVIGRPKTALNAVDGVSDGTVVFNNGQNNTTNAMSLAFLIAWPPSKVGDKPRVSLYSGGDGEGYIETRLLPFLSDIDRVTVIKAGHHGSELTLQPSFISQLDPLSLVISAGDAYKHPHWTRLAFLFLHWSRQIYEKKRSGQAFIWSTCYPYWTIVPPRTPVPPGDLAAKETADVKQLDQMKKLLNVSPFYDPDDKLFRTTLDDWYKAYLSALDPDEIWQYQIPNIREVYERIIVACNDNESSPRYAKPRAPQPATMLVLLPALMDMFREIWDTLSDIPLADTATNAIDSNGDSVFGTPRLSQLWVKHRNTDADGEIVVHRNGVWQESSKKVSKAKDKTEVSIGDDWRMQAGYTTRGGRKTSVAKRKGEEAVPAESKRQKKLPDPQPPPQPPQNLLFARFLATTTIDGQPAVISTVSALKLRFITSSELKASPTSVALHEDDPLDDFLVALTTERVAFDDTLQVPAGQVTSFQDVALSKKSDFVQWMREAICVTTVRMSVVVDRHISVDGSAKITNWTCIADLGKANGGSDGINLEFSSASNVLSPALNLKANTVGDIIEDTGYSMALGAVILALSREPTASISLAQICAFLHHPLEWLGPLLDDIKLKVSRDTDQQGDVLVHRSAANAIWIRPEKSFSTVIRLHLRQAEGSRMEDFIKVHLPNITIADVRFVALKEARRLSFQKESSYVYKIDSKLTVIAKVGLGQSGTSDFLASIGYGTDGLDVCLRWDGASDPIADLINWMNERLQSSDTNRTRTKLDQSMFDTFLGDLGAKNPLKLRRVFLQLGSDKRLHSVRIEFEVDLDFGAPKGTEVPILATFFWNTNRFGFRAELWPPSLLPEDHPGPWLWPKYEPWLTISPSSKHPQDHFSLLYLRPADRDNAGETIDRQHIPAGVPTEIYDAVLEINSSYTKISAEVECDAASMKSQVPMIALESLRLSAEYRRAQGNKAAEFLLSMEGSVTLESRENTLTPGYRYPDADPSVKLSYQSQTPSTPESWSLSVTAYGIQLASLYSLFPTGGPQDAVMNLLEHLYIPEISVVYQYNKGEASSFVSKGVIVVADVELDLHFEHHADGWSFEAVLTPEKRATLISNSKSSWTLGSLLEDLSEEMLEYVPDLIANIPIKLEDNFHVGLKCQSNKTSEDRSLDKPGSLTMAFVVEVGALQMTLVQIQDYSRNSDKSKASAETQRMSPKRMVKITLDEFHFPDIGLVGQFKQPFESLDFVWTSLDLQELEVTALNQGILQDSGLFPGKKEPLRFKKPDAGSTVAISAGCHLMLAAVRSGVTTVILDYPFGSGKQSGASTTPAPVDDGNALPPKAPTLQGSGDEISTSIAESRDALTITSLGLALKHRVLSITLTAELAFGPLTLGLIDFVLHIDYGDAKHLRDIDKIAISASIGGMEVKYNKAPVILAGLFRHIVKDGSDLYAGGVKLGITPYNFLAAGMYGDATGPPPSKETFKTMFIFVKLNGPLVELEFAEINGICGGFGYNSNLKFPEISQLAQFPLLTTDGSAKDPLDELNALTNSSEGWITPKKGALWLAAGLEIKAFQVVDISAVAAINLGESITIGLFAEAVAKLPKGVPDAEVLLLVDFLFTAQVNLTKGSLIVGGELAPRSFVLHKSCRLTGGMALAYWFPDSDHAGDWVFTIGGYHPQFKKPGHYPDASRVGISWQYDDHLYISGGAYFALTPKLCMAGVRLQARFQMDSLSAYFEAHADFLVNFEPFQFQGDIGVSIHVDYEIDYLVGHDTISIDISAGLKLHGPPVGGTAFIDIHVFSTTIDFGEDYKPKPARTLEQFWSTICQGKDEQIKHTILVESGLVTRGPGQPTNVAVPKPDFEVLAHSFSCRVVLRAAASSIQYGKDPVQSGSPVHAKLCKTAGNNLKSDATVRVYKIVNGSPEATPLALTMTPEKKKLPSSLWGEYVLALDPDYNPSAANAALWTDSADTIEHIMGATLRCPLPKPSGDHIPAIKLEEASKVHLLTDKNNPPQIPVSVHDAALPAPFDKGEDAKAAWQKTDLAISRDKVLAAFSSLVAATGGSKESAEFKKLDTSQPRQLLAEWHDLFANPPDTKPKIEAPKGTAAAPPPAALLKAASPRSADPNLWYSGLPWK